MGFKNLVYFIISMINESSQNALERYFTKTGKDGYISQQVFSLARQKIRWEAFQELLDVTVTVPYREYKEEMEKWNGLQISATDGSKLSLPNDEPLREYFGTSGTGNTSPTAQGSLLYDILNDLVLNTRIEPMSTDERTLAWMHINHLTRMESFKDLLTLINKSIETKIFDNKYWN